MAYYGLRYPYIAKYDRVADSYSGGFRCGQAVSVEATPNYISGILYADDQPAENEQEFQNVDMTLGVTELPLQTADTMFGHTVDMSTKKVIKKAGDQSQFVGVGIVGVETVKGKRSFVAKIWTCVKFAEPGDNMVTKGESITFNTPSIKGTGITDANEQWQITQAFERAEEATSFIEDYLGITA